AISVEGFLGVSQTSRVAFRQAAVAIPLASSLFVVAGLRYLFRLPVELRANWVFRMEAENPIELLGGVEAFLAYAALIPLGAIAPAPATPSARSTTLNLRNFPSPS